MDKSTQNPPEEPAGAALVVQGNTRFALDLYQKLSAAEGNLFFSPYSISTALAMVYAGAAGNTQTQMAQALHFPQDQGEIHPEFSQLRENLIREGKHGHIELKIANSIWPQKGHKFLKSYSTLLKKFYGVRITPVDFSDEETARQKINTWVEDKTGGRIKDILAAGVLDAWTRLVLVNAIYFKGQWKEPFKPHLTSAAPFWIEPEKQVNVQMMKQEHNFQFSETEDLQILELPYTGDDLSMVILLPRETFGLKKVEGTLSAEKLAEWLNGLVATEAEVSLPRFELSFPFQLDDALKSLGIVDAFTEAADFSGMNGQPDLYLGAVLHKAFVSVNEQGTEAAAATAVVMQTKSLSFPAVTFCADHPFIFLIRDNATGSILFLGRVMSPA